MDIKRTISEAQGLTPTEQQLGISALAMGEDVRGLSIKEFAARTNVSVASVHRFCKKLGLEGFKDLKVELIRQAAETGNRRDVDINFPFDATSTPAQVMERMEGLYQTTLAETQELLDPTQLDQAAKLIVRAGTVDSGFWEQVPVFPFLSGLHPSRPAHIRLSFCTLVRQFVLPSVRGSSCWMFFRGSAMLPASYALCIRLPYSVLRGVRQVSRPRMAIQT